MGKKKREKQERAFAKLKKALTDLQEKGLGIGAVIKFGGEDLTVVNIHFSSLLVYGQKKRGGSLIRIREIDKIELITPPSRNFDNWVPSSYLRINSALAKEIKDGKYGEEVKPEVVRRDFFFQTKTVYYLSKWGAEKIKEIKEKKLASHREALDTRFCCQCGKQIRRPKDCSFMQWSKVFRCSECLGNKQRLGEWRFCSRCGSRFRREPEVSIKEWASRRNCRSCRALNTNP
jgi:hypothetical protein